MMQCATICVKHFRQLSPLRDYRAREDRGPPGIGEPREVLIVRLESQPTALLLERFSCTGIARQLSAAENVVNLHHDVTNGEIAIAIGIKTGVLCLNHNVHVDHSG